MTEKFFSVWEGIFKSFEEAGGDRDAFDDEIWINKQKSKASKFLEDLNINESISDLVLSKDYPLSLVASMMLAFQERLSILDFGGGMGFQYLELLAKVPGAQEKIDFYVIEGKSTLRNIPPHLKDYKNLIFFNSFEEIDKKIDIIHMGSVLPYIDDWEGLLRRLVEIFKPKCLVFSDLMAGNIPTFVTHQIFYDKRIPHRFFNREEFEKYVDALGFNLIFQSKFIKKILNQEALFPNQALPETHRIDRALNLIFYRR